MSEYFKDLEKIIDMENQDYMKIMNKTALTQTGSISSALEQNEKQLLTEV